jgi:hypothetical protein
MECYQEADLCRLTGPANTAAIEWSKECRATYERKGDWGSCVLGAGIEIPFLKPRAKYPTYKMIISASHVCPWQGSCVWEESVPKILAILESLGVVGARYNCGRMD